MMGGKEDNVLECWCMECLQVSGLMVVVNIIPFSKGISTGFCTGSLGGVILVVFIDEIGMAWPI
jgi:hypothetical protein